jgi:serine/threonine protein kinase
MGKFPRQGKRWLEPVAGFEDSDRSATLSDFYLIKTLGKGSYGKVVSIKSKKTGKDYAMKIMTKKMLVKYKMMKQLLNEITIMRKLSHENIIRYWTHFEDDDYIYLILDLAENGHLFDKLRKKGLFKEEDAARVIFQLLKAVNYMHTQSPPIVHRDIKPENILFQNDQVKLADFGWSCSKDKLDRDTFCGTRSYLAPEMLLKKGHDEKLDVWTIGVIFYELCTGKTPFKP